MLRQKRCAVHRMHQQHVKRVQLRQGKAAPVEMRHPIVEPEIRAGKGDLDRFGLGMRLVDQRGQRCAGPFAGADRLVTPGHRMASRRNSRAPVAGAFQRHRHCHFGHRADVGHRERGWIGEGPGQGQAMVGLVDERHVEMVQQVMDTGWGDVAGQRLEQRAAVAVGKTNLVQRKDPVLGFGAPRKVQEDIADAGHPITSSLRSSISPKRFMTAGFVPS